MSDQTPPGWYAAPGDPPGTHRYWDGAQWIGEPQPLPPTIGTPAGGAMLPSMPYPLADPWKRIAARIIDAVIVAVALTPILIAAVDVDGSSADAFTFDVNPGVLILSVIAGAAYEILFVAFAGGTPGKLMLGLRVARQDDGAIPPGMAASALRYLPGLAGNIPIIGLLVSIVVFILSLVWLFTDSGRRTVWDRLASTYVLQK